MANFTTAQTAQGARAAIDEGLRAHMNKVYGLMSLGTLLTFAVAWAVGTTPAFFSMLRDPMTGSMTILGWITMFAPLGMVFMFGSAINRLSMAGAQLFFYVFAALMGLSMAWIFVAFTGTSIAQVFLVTSIAFAGLSLVGYTTKKDLSGMGTFLIMGVIGLLVASLLNLWFQSGAMAFAINALGVLIFAGLTAYDTQQIKNTYVQMAYTGNEEWLGKAAIMGALSLYLDFINMFMFLLQLFGNRE